MASSAADADHATRRPGDRSLLRAVPDARRRGRCVRCVATVLAHLGAGIGHGRGPAVRSREIRPRHRAGGQCDVHGRQHAVDDLPGLAGRGVQRPVLLPHGLGDRGRRVGRVRAVVHRRRLLSAPGGSLASTAARAARRTGRAGMDAAGLSRSSAWRSSSTGPCSHSPGTLSRMRSGRTALCSSPSPGAPSCLPAPRGRGTSC